MTQALIDQELHERCTAEINRLRAQNKASSDAWTKHTAAMESDIAKTRALFKKAAQWVDEQIGKPWWTESVYGKYAAVLMMERAEKAEHQLEQVRTALVELLDGELAHRSRDYGRGVAQAARHIQAVLDRTD